MTASPIASSVSARFSARLARAFAALLVTLSFAVVVTASAATLAGCQRYDQLVDAASTSDQKWADLDAQLQRRADLIPNLVATVKAAATHEEDTLTKVMEARANATSIKLTGDDLEDPAKLAAFQKAQDQLKGSLSRLLAVQENYPQLQANQNFHSLQVQIEGTENRILRAREEYNAAVKTYNSELNKVNGQVVNRITGHPFKARAYFTASVDAQAAPKVQF